MNKRKLCLVPEIYDKTLAKLPFSQLPTRKTQKSTRTQRRFSFARHKSQGPPLHWGFECPEQSKTCGLISPAAIVGVFAEAGKEKATRDACFPSLAHLLAPWRGAGRMLGANRRPPSPEAAGAEDREVQLCPSSPSPREEIPRCLTSTSLAISQTLKKLDVQRMGLWNVMKIRPSYCEANPGLKKKITKHQQSTWLSV